jgi:hypothetical protein
MAVMYDTSTWNGDANWIERGERCHVFELGSGKDTVYDSFAPDD